MNNSMLPLWTVLRRRWRCRNSPLSSWRCPGPWAASSAPECSPWPESAERRTTGNNKTHHRSCSCLHVYLLGCWSHFMTNRKLYRLAQCQSRCFFLCFIFSFDNHEVPAGALARTAMLRYVLSFPLFHTVWVKLKLTLSFHLWRCYLVSHWLKTTSLNMKQICWCGGSRLH